MINGRRRGYALVALDVKYVEDVHLENDYLPALEVSTT